MRLTNMSFAMLYVGWLNYLMITVLPATIICTILLHPVFSATNAFVTAIFIMMYNVLSALFMFTIGTFFNHCKLLKHMNKKKYIVLTLNVNASIRKQLNCPLRVIHFACKSVYFYLFYIISCTINIILHYKLHYNL